MVTLLEEFFISDETIDKLNKKEEKSKSLWIQDKDLFKPSSDIIIKEIIDPGAYTVDYDRNIGYFAKTLNFKSDELFKFSNAVTSDLIEEISLFWTKAELYKENKLLHKRGILLEGYPGTGKSSLISILADEIVKKGGVVFKVKDCDNLDIYIEFIRNSFRKIQPDTPIITILEDIDQYQDMEAELLDFLDGKTNIEHHVVIATTNNTEILPDSLLRASRLDLRIETPLPCEETRREYFKYKNIPESDIENLVSLSEGLSLADLKEIFICIYLLDYTIDDAIDKVTENKEKKNFLQTKPLKSKLGI